MAFSRRKKSELDVKSNVPVVGMDEIEGWKDKIDVVDIKIIEWKSSKPLKNNIK